MKLTEKDIERLNHQFRGIPPPEVISWAIGMADRPIISTNFRPYESTILHAVTQVKNDIPVLWCDTGYNTPYTYHHAEELIANLNLDIRLYLPKRSMAHREAVMGQPGLDDPSHPEFTREVKLEPFRRGMNDLKPDVWFCNLRRGQTAFRNTLNILNITESGVLKVCPFFYWNDQDLDAYLKTFDLPNETRYFDPTKVESNRECGLHIS